MEIFIKLFFIMGILSLIVDVFLIISNYVNKNNKGFLEKISKDKKDEYIKILEIKVVIGIIFLLLSIYFYLHKRNTITIVLLIINNLVVSFFEKIVKEII